MLDEDENKMHVVVNPLGFWSEHLIGHTPKRQALDPSLELYIYMIKKNLMPLGQVKWLNVTSGLASLSFARPGHVKWP